MIRSYTIFIGKGFVKRFMLFAAAVFFALICLGITSKYTSLNFINGLVPSLCMILFPAASVVSMAQIYNANLPDQTGGYKYFHSIKNSERHFRNAIIFGNLFTLMLTVPTCGIMMLFFPYGRILFLVAFSLISVGVMNFCGHLRSVYARIVPLAMLGGGVGVFFAISEDMEAENAGAVPIIFTAAALAVYVAGTVFSVARARSVWRREDMHKEKAEKKSSEKSESISPKKDKKLGHGGAAFLSGCFARAPKIAKVITVVISLITVILPFIAHEPVGDEDYLFPKVFIFFPSVFIVEMSLILLYRDFGNNKFARSMPIAKNLYTRTVPYSISFMTVGFSTAIMAAYFVFLALTNAESAQYSDTLVIGSLIIGGVLFFAPCLIDFPAGGVLVIYAAALPIAAVLLLADDTKKVMGFGVPLYLAVIMFALTAIWGTVWAFFISRRKYVKSDVKIVPQTVNT